MRVNTAPRLPAYPAIRKVKIQIYLYFSLKSTPVVGLQWPPKTICLQTLGQCLCYMVKGDLAVMNKLGVMMQRPCYRFLKWVPHSSIEKDREFWPETVNRLHSGSRTEVSHCQSQGTLAASKTDKARTGISARAGREEESGQHFDVSLRRLIVNSQLLEMDKKSVCVLIPRTCYATTKKTQYIHGCCTFYPGKQTGCKSHHCLFAVCSLGDRTQNRAHAGQALYHGAVA